MENIIPEKDISCDCIGGLLVLSDTRHRKDMIEEYGKTYVNKKTYPLINLYRKKRNSGCYMFYRWINKTEIVPLYAGRTIDFYTRMWTHCNDPRNIFNTDRYAKLVEKLVKKYEYESLIEYALWIIESKTKRRNTEHKLIGKYKPLLNKD